MIGDDQLFSLVGEWAGDEQLAQTAWAPAGTAHGRLRISPGPGGGLLVDYLQERGGATVAGHGVLSGSLWWWFDSLGFVPHAPGLARWQDEELVLERRSDRGRNVTVLRVQDGGLEQRIETASNLVDPLDLFLRGSYVRHDRVAFPGAPQPRTP